MKKIIYILSFFSLIACATSQVRNISSTEKPRCSTACNTAEICMNTFTDAGNKCMGIPKQATMGSVALPFDKNTEVICTHSSGSGSHSGSNAFFAIDLANPYAQSAPIVRAAADGIAYVFVGENNKLCPEPPGNPSFAEISSCGDSWGNRIKILHADGYFSFYVHLDRLLVKNGDTVKKGDAIGVMGWTGAAGHRHLHWSVQKLPGNSTEWPQQILTYVGESVPFQFSARQNGVLKLFDSFKISCAHANIGNAPANQQPKFSGVD